LTTNFRGRGRRPPTSVDVGKLEWLPNHAVWTYRQYVFSFCHKARVWCSDGEKDKITIPNPALLQLCRAVKCVCSVQVTCMAGLYYVLRNHKIRFQLQVDRNQMSKYIKCGRKNSPWICFADFVEKVSSYIKIVHICAVFPSTFASQIQLD